MSLALELFRSAPRYIAARSVGSKLPGLLSGPLAPLRLVDREEPHLPGEGWARIRPLLSGICGSDLNTVSGGSSFYFMPLVSMPFVPGHEVVGRLQTDAGDLAAGQRVVIDPVLGCAARGIDPMCGPCASGDHGLCERLTSGHVSPGLQTGYCADTGGGWSGSMIAHRSQMHPVPDDLSDRAAVLIEPLACAIHAVRRAAVPSDATVLVVGAGSVGLLTVMALRLAARPGRVMVVAKHRVQAELARRLGAEVVSSDEALGAVRRATGAFRLTPQWSPPFLLGGADVSFECAGSKSGLELALNSTRGRGRVVLAGMPEAADLSPAWFRELEIAGAYSGTGAFTDAIALAPEVPLEELVGPVYPLAQWRRALEQAFSAGSLGAVKVVFDPRRES